MPKCPPESEKPHRTAVEDAPRTHTVRITQEAQATWNNGKLRRWRPIDKSWDLEEPEMSKIIQQNLEMNALPQTTMISRPAGVRQPAHASSQVPTKQSGESDCPDSPSSGMMGQQACIVGEDPQWHPICRDLRAVSKLQQLDPSLLQTQPCKTSSCTSRRASHWNVKL